MIVRAAWSYKITIGGARVKKGVDGKPREVSVHTLRRGQLQRRQRAISSLITLRFPQFIHEDKAWSMTPFLTVC